MYDTSHLKALVIMVAIAIPLIIAVNLIICTSYIRRQKRRIHTLEELLREREAEMHKKKAHWDKLEGRNHWLQGDGAPDFLDERGPHEETVEQEDDKNQS